MDTTGPTTNHARADALVKEFETRLNHLDRLITSATTTQHTAAASVIGKLLPRQLTELRQHVENLANELRPFIATHKEVIEHDKAAKLENERKEFEEYKRATEQKFVEREAALKLREAGISKAKEAVQEVVENLAKEQGGQLPIPQEDIRTANPKSIIIDDDAINKLQDALSWDLQELKISTDDLEGYVRQVMKEMLPKLRDIHSSGENLNERIEDIYNTSQTTSEDLSRLKTTTNAISDQVTQVLTLRRIDMMSPGGPLGQGTSSGLGGRTSQQSLSNASQQEPETGDNEGSRKRRRSGVATDDNEGPQGTSSPVLPGPGSGIPILRRDLANRTETPGRVQKKKSTTLQLQSPEEASDQTKAMFYQMVLPTDNWTDEDTLQLLRTIETFWTKALKDPAVRPDSMFEKVANKGDDGCYNSQQQKVKPSFRDTDNTKPCTKCVNSTGTKVHPCFKVDYVSEEPGQYNARSTEKRWRLVKRPW
ncbi:MAG: hypothetical protein LQ346_008070 [Caloplaca aetnensis]|nr:MAG: hypothetical protein LQ346_008070 [Caloplaca aetnensis]